MAGQPGRDRLTVSPDARPDWWRRAVVYQVYLRSFADADGDGVGDIRGIRSRLGYLRDLGVDAIWITPWYVSPMADAGYDVADFRAIDPRFGDLADAEDLIREAHAHGIRVIVDLVPNHTSDQHRWFRAALAAPAGDPTRARYWYRPGRGPAGDQPPNDWQSVFGGPAWTREVRADGGAGEWYLHLFAAQQPDLDWGHDDVRAEFLDVLRFWFDRGADGARLDVAHALAKDPGLPDVADWQHGTPHPHWGRDEVRAIHAGWRALADGYDPPRVLTGEIHVATAERLATYLGPGRLHTAFGFAFLRSAWDGPALRATIDTAMAALPPAGAPPTWVLSNHDEVRHVSRYGRADTAVGEYVRVDAPPPDLALGTRRARAAILLALALPGTVSLYQGEELGLPEVDDLPADARQDPIFARSGGVLRGRDGCRVPLPWSGSASPYGFGPDGSVPWLPQPAAWAALTVDRQAADEGSMLSLYRTALAIRRRHPGLAGEAFAWVNGVDGPAVLHLRRDAGLGVIVNLGAVPVALPPGTRVVLASVPLAAGGVPPDATCWYEPDQTSTVIS